MISFPSIAPCLHEGPCAPGLSPAECSVVQVAASRKYDVNLTWNIAEIAEGTFALFNPVHRDLVAIGSLDEVIAAYRARPPFTRITRETLPSRKRLPAFADIVVNI